MAAILLDSKGSKSHTARDESSSPEALARRSYFYVGGSYTDDGSGNGATVMEGQMYVEQLLPYGGAEQKFPLVFVHGGAQTGTNWLNTPDGRQGWASWFLERGYAVYLVDQPERGRSPAKPVNDNLGVVSVQFTESYFTATKDFKLWPQAELHSQWPGTGRQGDPIFDAFYASQVPQQKDALISERNNRHAITSLLDRIGPSIIVTHSQSGSYGWVVADSRPALVKGILAIEPSGPPFESKIFSKGAARPYGIAFTPLTYEPPVIDPTIDLPTSTIHLSPGAGRAGLTAYKLQAKPARKLVNIAQIPIMVVTSESGYHAVYDFATVEYLRQAGVVDVEHLELAKEGIHGNGHFCFMEKNQLEIVERVRKWVEAVSQRI